MASHLCDIGRGGAPGLSPGVPQIQLVLYLMFIMSLLAD